MLGHKYKNSAVERALNNILDTFSGGDNHAFVHFLAMLRNLDEQASNGDKPAQVLIKMVLDFNKLIEIAPSAGRHLKDKDHAQTKVEP